MPIAIVRNGPPQAATRRCDKPDKPLRRFATAATCAVLPAVIIVFGLGSIKPGPATPEQQRNGFYVGSTGILWPSDHGVLAGGCDRDAISQADDMPAAALGGPLFTATAPTRADEDTVDAGDRACIGQALELASGAHDVAWRNARTRAAYRVAPAQEYARGTETCRRFVLQVSADHGSRRIASAACTHGDGAWRVVGRPEEKLI